MNQRIRRELRRPNRSWRVDETYGKVAANWAYLYLGAIAELKESGELGRRCRCRTAPYLNNVIEQNHRLIKKRVTAGLGFRSTEAPCRTIEGYEAMHAIRKGQIRWVAKGDPVGQRQFIHTIFGVAA